MTLKEFLKGIADAIRAKEGSTADIPAQDMAARIGAIETGTQLPTLTNPGAAGDLRSGKQLIGQDGSTVDGSLAEVTQATPGISVSSSGLITASVTQSGGIVTAGTKSATKQLTTQAAKTVTPGVSSQTAVASGRYTTGAVTVAGDSNLVAGNIKSGVSIFGVTGTAKKIATVTGISYYDESNDIIRFSLDQTLTTLETLYVSSIYNPNNISLDDFIGDQYDSPEQPDFYLWIKNADMAIHIAASPDRTDYSAVCDDGLVTYTLRGNYVTAEMNNSRIGFPLPKYLSFINGFAIGE